MIFGLGFKDVPDYKALKNILKGLKGKEVQRRRISRSNSTSKLTSIDLGNGKTV